MHHRYIVFLTLNNYQHWMINLVCLRTSGSEASSRLAGPGPQWAIALRGDLGLTTAKVLSPNDPGMALIEMRSKELS